MSDGQEEGEASKRPEAAAQEHAIAGKEAQEKGQEVSDAYDAHEDAEAIKLWLWYR